METRDMEAREKIAWLNRYQRARRKERRLREVIRTERARCEATSAALTGMPHGGAEADKLGHGVSLLLDYQQDLAAQLVESERVRREIEAAIAALPDPMQREALTGHYVDGLEWWKVANRMYISERWARSLHKKALENLQTVPLSSGLPVLK